MSLRVRMLAIGAALVLILVALALAVHLAVSRVADNRSQITMRLDPATVQSRAIATSLVDQETGQRGYVISGDDSFLAPYRDGRRQFDQEVRSLHQLLASDGQLTRLLDDVVTAAERWRAVGAAPEIAARRSGGETRADALVRSGVGKSAFDDVRAATGDLQSAIDARLATARDRDAAALRLLRVVTVLGPLIVLLLVAVLLLLTRRWVVKPLLAVQSSMRSVAAGELSREIPATGPPEVAALGRDAEAMRRRIVEELNIARSATEALQQHSPAVSGLQRELASPAAWHTARLEVAGVVHSAEGVLAGDWWAPHLRPDGTTSIVIADVSGHGTAAGLVALRFKHRLLALLDTDLPLGNAFTIAATGLVDDPERFVACLCLVVDPVAQQVTWVNAGHPPGLLVRGATAEAPLHLEPTGPIVSSLTTGWAVRTEQMRVGDLLMLATDGILEARDGQGREFGEVRLLDTIRKRRPATAADAVGECMEAVRHFAVDVRRDDVTCVAVRLLDDTRR